MITLLQINIHITYIHIYCQFDDSSTSDSDEEPSPEALARYLAIRRNTVGVGDSRHEVPDDMRAKLAAFQPIIAQPQPNLFMPFGMPVHANLPFTTPINMMTTQHYSNMPFSDQHHLQLPQMAGPGLFVSSQHMGCDVV